MPISDIRNVLNPHFGIQPATDTLEICLVTIQISTWILYFALYSWATAGPLLSFWANTEFLSAAPSGDSEKATLSARSNKTGERGTQLWWWWLECHIPPESQGIWLCQKTKCKFNEQWLQNCEPKETYILKYSEVCVNISCILHVKYNLWPKALSKMDLFFLNKNGAPGQLREQNHCTLHQIQCSQWCYLLYIYHSGY